MSPTHPINMSSNEWKPLKLEQNTFALFLIPSTVVLKRKLTSSILEFSGPHRYENRFTIRCSRLCIIHTRFEVRCVLVILENVLYNQNVSVRHMKNFLQASKVKFFAKNPSILSLKLCQASEYSVMLFGFLAKTLTSDVCRKLFMSRTHTFWVCKTFS